MSFVHLHLHTEFSLLDGACRIKKLVERVKELGQDAVAITDHGCMYGVIDFTGPARPRGSNPSSAARSMWRHGPHPLPKVHEFDADSRHLVLLAGTRRAIETCPIWCLRPI